MKKTLNRNFGISLLLGAFSIFFFLNFQTNPQLMIKIDKEDYNSAWKTIDSLDKKGLPKSALEKVVELYEKAKTDGNYPQIIKTIIYRGKYQNQLEEDGLVNAIYKMQEEIEQADEITKGILHSVTAEMYQNYLNQNRWQFQNRTTPVEFKNEDIRTWTIEQLIDKTGELYLASLESRSSKNIKIDDFDAILHKGQNDVNLRPNLYDFLIHRAIDYFKTDQAHLTQPVHQFLMTDPDFFLDGDEFSKLEITSKDLSSLKYQTLLLFQDLIEYRIEDNNIPALIDADLKRLKFVYDQGTVDSKFELYLEALENLLEKYSSNPASSDINYAVANLYWQAGQAYDVKSGTEDKRKWYWKTALEVAEKGIKAHPESFGANQCKLIKNQIQQKELRSQLELVNLPNTPILAKITFRNVNKVYLKAIQMNDDRWKAFKKAQERENKGEQEAVLKYLNTLDPIQSQSYNLSLDGDLRTHSTEVKLEGLSFGQNAILVANNPNYSKGLGAAGYSFTHISNIGFFKRNNNYQDDDFIVFDRKTGAPLEGVEVTFANVNYNSIFRKEDVSKNGRKVISDENGFITRPTVVLQNNRRNAYTISLKKGKDHLRLDDRFYNYGGNRNSNSYQTCHFFLDRAIYRPGQTIHFKGIVMNVDKDKMPSVLPNQKVRVTFRDVNYQEVAVLDLQSNEYGSFNGSFTAPKTGLLGQMSLQSSIGNSRKVFRVEEYKRPKFKVDFKPLEGSFKLNEAVSVTGHAKAFAGNNIDGAAVNYQVVREVRFPWTPWWYWRGGYNPYHSQSQVVANGTTETDENGEFTIDFNAIPDSSIPKDKNPEFWYKVVADVIDITGETHTGERTVKVGSIALALDVPVKDKIQISDFRLIEINSKNLNGAFEAATGSIKLEKLELPKQSFINRYWNQPDIYTLSKEEYKNAFPNYAFANEGMPQHFKVEKTVFQNNFNTKITNRVAIPKIKLEPGKYALTIQSRDKFGTPVEVKKYFELFEIGNSKVPSNDILWHYTKEETALPGNQYEYSLASFNKNQPIFIEIEKKQEIVSRKWINLKNIEKESIEIKEEDRGNVFYHLNYAFSNRSFNKTHTIKVPWSNKELNIEYQTFRDKMKPGDVEEWIVTIKGEKGEQVSAELLAGMYDASLDEFVVNDWNLDVYPQRYSIHQLRSYGYSPVNSRIYNNWQRYFNSIQRSYSSLNWFGFNFYASYNSPVVMKRSMARESDMMMMNAAPAPVAAGVMDEEVGEIAAFADSDDTIEEKLPTEEISESQNEEGDFSDIKVRENLDETVFFYPNLMTDTEGNVVIKFTMKEALTKWKFLGLAHSKDLKIGLTSKEVVTQKELMVIPNPPRFFREHDEIEFTAKVVNLSESTLNGSTKLDLNNAVTGLPILKDVSIEQSINLEAGASASFSWRFKVPDVSDVSLIEHTVLAQAGNYSDAERSVAPTHSNRMLVTETKPLPVRENSSKEFIFKSLANNNSNTLKHHSLSLEFTSNPAWYAIQALPYLMEYPHDCTEQIFSRYYANSLAEHVSNSQPRIKKVFERWRDYDTDALMSNLSKNEELKSALLAETPWVLNAQSEEQQKKNIALLFDLNKMAFEKDLALSKLKERQLPNGGWAWFPGGRDSWYISQYLVEGFGHLNKLGVTDITDNPNTWNMVQAAVRYIDQEMVEYFEKNIKSTDTENDRLNNLAIHYLYTRSFFLENSSTEANVNSNDRTKPKTYIPLRGKSKEVFDFYIKQSEKYWLNKGFYQEGMIALALHRVGKRLTTSDMIKSFKERSLNNEEMGMYFKYNAGYWWYQLPIETHSLMIEVFEEVAQDAQAVNDLKVWLLKNKQTNHWETTKATAAATYALLMNGDNWLEVEAPVNINFNGKSSKEINKIIKEAQSNAEAGTGYFKSTFDKNLINADLAKVEIKNNNNVPAWGGLYWQYFEDLDKIEHFEETPLTLKKDLFKSVKTDSGEEMLPIENTTLAPGDLIKVRIELRVDRDMEYVHMKDARASGFEPINVLSQYKWQDGLGYYESTGDAATNFFFGYLPKGTFVFEYSLRVIHKGDFSNGITTIQSMYAPEFSSHSKGIRVEVN